MKFLFFSLAITFIVTLISSCSSIVDPNHNELASDKLWAQQKYTQALKLIEPAADKGHPWAQLRLGIAHEYGQGKKQDHPQALRWYRKAAVQTEESAWADGLPLLSAGKEGYFNQNNDANVAQYLIARLYTLGDYGVEKNYSKALAWAKRAKTQSKGSDLIYCCENSILRKQKIKFERIEELITNIKKNLSPEELEKLKQKS